MHRHELTDEQFNKIEHFLPGRKEHVGVTAKDNRAFISGKISLSYYNIDVLIDDRP